MWRPEAGLSVVNEYMDFLMSVCASILLVFP